MTLQELMEQEAYKIPTELMGIIMDCRQRENLLSEMSEKVVDETHDYLRDIFQKEHGDRDKLKQDYTPASITMLLGKLMPEGNSLADVCAGTGALSIACGNVDYTYCEEFSERAIPFLLCNFALRNRNADIVNCNALTGETTAVYHLTPGERFSNIEIISQSDIKEVDNVIMNPPCNTNG